LSASSNYNEFKLCSEYIYTIIYFIDNKNITLDESVISLFSDTCLALFHHLNYSTIFVLKSINFAMNTFPIREVISHAGLEAKLVDLFSQVNEQNLFILFDASSHLLVALHPNLSVNLFSSEYFVNALSFGLWSVKELFCFAFICLDLFCIWRY
jgi:hypothetical protein